MTTTAGADVEDRAPLRAHRRTSKLAAPETGRVLAFSVAAVVLVLAALGLAERLWIVDHFPINSDQAVVGLMAKAILHGHFVAFFWGQHYAGVEPYLTAVLFALFGSSDTVLNLTPVVLAIAASWLVYRIACYFLPRPLAVLGAVAIWVWPLISVTNSTEEIGYVLACLDLGLLSVLFAIRISDGRGKALVNWAMVGLALGGCVWASPECLYFFVPCAWFLVPVVVGGWHRERGPTVRRMAVGTAGAAIGGLPFWWATVATRFATITHPNTAPYPGTLASRTTSMFTHALPIALGWQRPYTGAWFGGPTVAIALLGLAGAVLVGAVVWAVLRRRARSLAPLIAFVVGYLVIYPLLPPTFSWQDGRYVFFLLFLLIVVGLYPLGVVSWRGGAVALSTLLVVGLAAMTVLQIRGVDSSFSVGQLRHALTVQRGSTTALADQLVDRQLTHGYASYWLAYKLDFESGNTLRYTPEPTDNLRNVAYLTEVDSAAHPAWIVCRPINTALCMNATDSPEVNPAGVSWASLSAWLHQRKIPFASTTIDGFTVVVPSVRVTPAALQQGAPAT